MNKSNICKKLIEKNLIKDDMKITAKVTISGFGYTTSTLEKTGIVAKISNDHVVISFDNKNEKVSFDKITQIEGMEIERFAKAYRVK